MKYLFFLLIIPFLFIPSANAEIGKNFDTVNNQDGTITWTSHYERILDDNGNYQDFIFTDNPNYLQVETALASVQLDKNSCEFSYFTSGIIGGKTPIIIDSIVPFQSVDGSGVWNKITSLDNAVCNTSWDGQNLIASKNVVGLGTLEYAYSFNGVIWKTELKAINESGLNDRLFGFEQIFNYNKDIIKFGGIQRNLDNFNGQIFDRTFLENNEAKVLNLLNGYKFDFDLGFDNLNQILINDNGLDSSLLTFQYFYNQNILPDGSTLIIDPTILPSIATDVYIIENDNDDVCEDTGSTTISINDIGSLFSYTLNTASSHDCYRSYIQFDTSGIPPAQIFLTATLAINVVTTSGDPLQRIYLPTTTDLTTRTAAQIMDEIDDDTLLGTYFASSTGVKLITFNATNRIDMSAAHLADDYLQFGFRLDNEVLTASVRGIEFDSDAGGTPPVLTILYGLFTLDAVTDLTITDTRATGVDLSWSAPTTNGTIIGYQINNTTPISNNVATILQNDTGNLATSAIISNLSGETPYSFRVGSRIAGLINASGNVVSTTTLVDPTEAFAAGTFNITQTGIDVRNFKFERIDINSTTLLLNVTYPNTFDTSCDFYYKFAMINRTYTSISDVAINSIEDEASFRFENVDNEIIEVTCSDSNSNATGDYLITQTSFLILQQIQDFQSGVFGTMGKFGAIDLITVFAVTISMIGFNRINESVGVILSVLIIGGLSIFQIIQWETTFTASLALAVLWAYTNTRKT